MSTIILHTIFWIVFIFVTILTCRIEDKNKGWDLVFTRVTTWSIIWGLVILAYMAISYVTWMVAAGLDAIGLTIHAFNNVDKYIGFYWEKYEYFPCCVFSIWILIAMFWHTYTECEDEE